MLGAIAETTERIELMTGVTCPTTRIHPAIVAQAAATAAALLPGRFSLGVGSGENLNEHVLGGRWPPVVERQERLAEAIQEYADAGYDHVYVHRIGPDQEGFFGFYEREVLPSLRTAFR